MVVYKSVWRDKHDVDEGERCVQLGDAQVRWLRPGSLPYVHFKDTERMVFVPALTLTPEQIVKRAMKIVAMEKSE